MPGSEQPVSDKTLDDHLKLILNRFESKSKRFDTSFRILLVFAVLFLFIIQIPFTSIQVKKNTVKKEIETTQNLINEKSATEKKFRNIQAGIKELHDAITNSPDKLRKFIVAEVKKSLTSTDATQMNQNLDLYNPADQEKFLESLSNIDKISKLVKEEVENHFQQFQEIMVNKIINPLDSLGINQLSGSLSDLDTLQHFFKSKFDQNPNFWFTFPAKQQFYLELDKNVTIFLARFKRNLNEQGSKLVGDLKSLKSSIDSLKNIEIEQKDLENNISARMEEIEFPFGKIPIGLNESINVYPLLIAFGWIFSISLFIDTIKLRKNLHNLYIRKDPENKDFIKQQIQLLAPLWIDPLKSAGSQKLKFLLLSSPIIFFIISIGIKIYTRTFSASDIVTDSNTWWIYVFSYLVCFFLFLFYLKKINRELSDYGANQM